MEILRGFFADALDESYFDLMAIRTMKLTLLNAKYQLGIKFDSAFNMSEANRLHFGEAGGTNLVRFTKVRGRNVFVKAIDAFGGIG